MTGEIICGIFASPPRPLPPGGEWACTPPAPVYLRGLNALSGQPHGIVSHMRELDIVSDSESHAGDRYFVVTVEGGSHPTCPKGRSASLAKRGCLGAEAYGDPMRNPMRDPGSRSGSVVPWAIECESRDKRKLSCNAKSLPDGCALENGSGIYRIF